MTELASNVLYHGDNLDILCRYLPDASVDLIYLDAPLNSDRCRATDDGHTRWAHRAHFLQSGPGQKELFG